MAQISYTEFTVPSVGDGLLPDTGQQSPTFWTLLVVGLLTTIGAVGWLVSSSHDQTQDTFSATAFYRGQPASSDWVAVTGRLLWEEAAYEGTDLIGTWHVPMVGNGWRSGDRVKLIVKVDKLSADDWGEEEQVNGMLTSSVPGYVRTFFEQEGPLPADGVMILNAGARPATSRRLAHLTTVVGLILCGLSFVIYDSDPAPRYSGPALKSPPQTLGPRPSDLAELRGEIAPDDPAIVERETEIQRWMREHGLPTDEAEAQSPGSDDKAEQRA